MIIKTYTAPYMARLCTTFIVDGRDIQVIFTGANKYTSVWAHYTTNDTKLQEAIEKHSLFKSGKIVLTEEIAVEDAVLSVAPIPIIKEQAQVVAVEDTEANEVEQENVMGQEDKTSETLVFESLADLQSYLQKNHQISFATIRSRANAIAKADELALSYTLLK